MADNNVPTLPTGFGRAAEKLADTVRHVVDLVAGSDRLLAKAKTQAEAEIISAEGRAQVQDIEARAVDRLRKRESRRQKNIESITIQAIKALPPPEQVSEEAVSEDWASRFFEECQDIGNSEMQQIWARILANEVARPKSFEPRTLSIVRDLTNDDAQLFARLCSFAWFIPGAEFVPVIHDVDAPSVTKSGITFLGLTHLTSIGLIEFGALRGFGIKKLNEITPQYCGKGHFLKAPAGSEFPIGKVIFTAVGSQLLRISGAPGDEEHRAVALAAWKKSGWNEPDDIAEGDGKATQVDTTSGSSGSGSAPA
jgi:Protein of unknown function (DUF2806)